MNENQAMVQVKVLGTDVLVECLVKDAHPVSFMTTVHAVARKMDDIKIASRASKGHNDNLFIVVSCNRGSARNIARTLEAEINKLSERDFVHANPTRVVAEAQYASMASLDRR